MLSSSGAKFATFIAHAPGLNASAPGIGARRLLTVGALVLLTPGLLAACKSDYTTTDEQPTPTLTATIQLDSMTPEDDVGWDVELQAVVDANPEPEDISYYWRVGADDPVAGGARFQALFPPLGKTEIISLDVVTSTGLLTQAQLAIAIPGGLTPFPHNPPEEALPPANCGCSGMVVRIQDNQQSDVYCQPNAGQPTPLRHYAPLANPLNANCPQGTKPFSIALGTLGPTPPTNVPSTGMGFEIVATLTQGSVPAQCDEGQFARDDLKTAGILIPNQNVVRLSPAVAKTLPLPAPQPAYTATPVAQGNAYPQMPGQNNPNDRWGPDNYTSAGRDKRYDAAPAIRWIDQPVLPVPGAAVNSMTRESEFIAFVLGTTGQPSCWCRFQTFALWRKGAAPVGRYRKVDGLNCNIP